MIDRASTYLRNMNEDKADYTLRIRYIWKVYQTGISPMYTIEERREILRGLIEDADNNEDLNAKAINLAFAYKIAQYNGFDVKVDPVELPAPLIIHPFPPKLSDTLIETLKKSGQYEKTMRNMDRLSPDDEIYKIFHVTISKDWFYLSTFKYNDPSEGITGDMTKTEADNRYNSNMARRLIMELYYAKCSDIRYHRVISSDGSEIENVEINDLKQLNQLNDPGRKKEEEYRVTFAFDGIEYKVGLKCETGDLTLPASIRGDINLAILTSVSGDKTKEHRVEGKALLGDIVGRILYEK